MLVKHFLVTVAMYVLERITEHKVFLVKARTG